MAAKKFQPGALIRTRVELMLRQEDQSELRDLIENMLDQRDSYNGSELTISQVRLLCRILDAIEYPEIMP